MKDQINILIENSKALDDSLHWLKRSYNICKEYRDMEQLTEEGYDAFETFLCV